MFWPAAANWCYATSSAPAHHAAAAIDHAGITASTHRPEHGVKRLTLVMDKKGVSMTRADEWHIKVDVETKRRLKAYAALHGLTIGQALKALLDLATK